MACHDVFFVILVDMLNRISKRSRKNCVWPTKNVANFLSDYSNGFGSMVFKRTESIRFLKKVKSHNSHPTQMWQIFLLDYSKGFGGKYGVQTDRVDKVRNKCMLYLRP